MKRSGPPERKTPMRRGSGLHSPGVKRGQPINPVSDKRKREDRERTKVLAPIREQQVWCTRCGKTGVGLDADEIKSAARGGSRTDPDNIQLLCRLCHDLKHNGSAEEMAAWSKQSWDD